MKLKHNLLHYLWLGSVVLFSACGQSSNQIQGSKPNIIFLLADDLGWRDLSCYGSQYYETPNIDRLASQGMIFTNAYAPSNVCSPSRAAILTGKYPAKLHLTDWIAGLDYPYAQLSPPEWTRHLPYQELTIAEALKEAGYQSLAIGKWHLGREEHNPLTQGFTTKVGGGPAGGPGSYFYPYPHVPDLENGSEGEYLTDRLTTEMLDWVEKNRESPFFVYFAFFNPHRPTQAKEKYIEKYEQKEDPLGKQLNPINAGMIHSLDENVGRIMNKLQELGLDDNTLLVFNSDNGGNHYADNPQKTNNYPLRAGKGSAYEGGIRVPLIMHWPGIIAPNSICEQPVIGMDYFPTFMEVAGVKTPLDIDGISLLPAFRKKPLTREAIYFHYPHYHHGGASPHSVIRRGNLKLIEFFEDGTMELYNIDEDLSETNDLSEERPKEREQLKQMLYRWRHSMKAQLPMVNVKHDTARAGEWKFYLEDTLW